MQRWLRIGLYTVATFIPLSIILYYTKRFFSRNDSKNRITDNSSTHNQRNSASTSSRVSPQIIHNYNSSIVELSIDQRNIGYIIGRGGEKIKRIQTEADVRIRFRDQLSTSTPNPGANRSNRIAVISGRPECTQLAKNMIEKMLQEKIRDEQPMEVRLQIPDRVCGRVIGQRGQNIRSMQNSSGARITIENPPNNTPARELRNCIISGTPEQIRTANEMIEAIVQKDRAFNFRNEPRETRKSSSTGYLSSPTRENLNSRQHYYASTDLRKDVIHVENSIKNSPPKSPKLDLISQEERIYLMYFSQQVQAHLQPLPLEQEYFTAYVSTVDRNGFIWIQLLEDIGMELQNLIDAMTSYYSSLVLENEKDEQIENPTDSLSLIAFDNEISDVIESSSISEVRKLSHDSNSDSDPFEREQARIVSQICDSENTTDSNLESPTESITNGIKPIQNTSASVESLPKLPLYSSPFQPGMLVAAPFFDDGKYYRAIIDRIDAENQAHVYFVDFGDNDMCKLTELRTLKEEFRLLPFQAVLCQLANIEVSPKGLSENAITRLQELTFSAQWKRIYIVPSKNSQPVDRSIACIRYCPPITIIDTNGPEDVNVNLTLIQEHLVNRVDYQHSFS